MLVEWSPVWVLCGWPRFRLRKLGQSSGRYCWQWVGSISFLLESLTFCEHNHFRFAAKLKKGSDSLGLGIRAPRIFGLGFVFLGIHPSIQNLHGQQGLHLLNYPSKSALHPSLNYLDRAPLIHGISLNCSVFRYLRHIKTTLDISIRFMEISPPDYPTNGKIYVYIFVVLECRLEACQAMLEISIFLFRPQIHLMGLYNYHVKFWRFINSFQVQSNF